MDMPVKESWTTLFPMLEEKVESYLCEQVEAMDGLCDKFVSPGHIGVPDRICTFMGGLVYFVETKRPKGGKLESWQIRDHERRWLLGVRVFVLWSRADVDEFIRSVKIILNQRAGRM